MPQSANTIARGFSQNCAAAMARPLRGHLGITRGRASQLHVSRAQRSTQRRRSRAKWCAANPGPQEVRCFVAVPDQRSTAPRCTASGIHDGRANSCSPRRRNDRACANPSRGASRRQGLWSWDFNHDLVMIFLRRQRVRWHGPPAVFGAERGQPMDGPRADKERR